MHATVAQAERHRDPRRACTDHRNLMLLISDSIYDRRPPVRRATVYRARGWRLAQTSGSACTVTSSISVFVGCTDL